MACHKQTDILNMAYTCIYCWDEFHKSSGQHSHSQGYNRQGVYYHQLLLTHTRTFWKSQLIRLTPGVCNALVNRGPREDLLFCISKSFFFFTWDRKMHLVNTGNVMQYFQVLVSLNALSRCQSTQCFYIWQNGKSLLPTSPGHFTIFRHISRQNATHAEEKWRQEPRGGHAGSGFTNCKETERKEDTRQKNRNTEYNATESRIRNRTSLLNHNGTL